MNKFLCVTDVAEMFKLSERTVWSLIKSGELPAVRIGRSVRIDESDIASFIDGSKYRVQSA